VAERLPYTPLAAPANSPAGDAEHFRFAGAIFDEAESMYASVTLASSDHSRMGYDIRLVEDSPDHRASMLCFRHFSRQPPISMPAKHSLFGLPLPTETIGSRIVVLRGQKVLIDNDLAQLYGVETRRLNEQVRRNPDRFPADFMFQLNNEEYAYLISQIATSKTGRGGRRKLPLAFSEHGALMAATVLNSSRAVEMSLYVVRAFVQLREVLATHKELATRLAELEGKTELLALKHDQLAGNTRAQLKQVFDAIRQLMTPPEPAKKRAIGFVSPKE